jgi:hypothetical protein
MICECLIIYKGTVVAYLKILVRNLAEEREKDHNMCSQNIGLQVDNWAADVVNMKQEYQHL